VNTDNLVVKLCIDGAHAEFEGRLDDARSLYWRAWEGAKDDFEACIAAHYVARFQQSPQDALHWNLEALARADAVKDERVQSFYPSLYANLGRSYELLGNEGEATRYYGLAAALGLVHQKD
jgi:hypothetical protein